MVLHILRRKHSTRINSPRHNSGMVFRQLLRGELPVGVPLGDRVASRHPYHGKYCLALPRHHLRRKSRSELHCHDNHSDILDEEVESRADEDLRWPDDLTTGT